MRLGWALTIARNTIGMITHGRVVIMQNQHCSEATHIKQGIDKHSKTVVKLLALDNVQINKGGVLISSSTKNTILTRHGILPGLKIWRLKNLVFMAIIEFFFYILTCHI